eukprot:gene25817-11492_t
MASSMEPGTSGSPPINYDAELTKSRGQVSRLRDRYVQRALHRMSVKAKRPGLYRTPDGTLPRTDGEGMGPSEANLTKLVATSLLEPSSMLPLDIDTLHKRMLRSPAGEKYSRTLSAMGLSSLEPLVHKLCKDLYLLEAMELTVNGHTAVFINNIARAPLAEYAGVEDHTPRPTSSMLPPPALHQQQPQMPPLVPPPQSLPLPLHGLPPAPGLPPSARTPPGPPPQGPPLQDQFPGGLPPGMLPLPPQGPRGGPNPGGPPEGMLPFPPGGPPGFGPPRGPGPPPGPGPQPHPDMDMPNIMMMHHHGGPSQGMFPGGLGGGMMGGGDHRLSPGGVGGGMMGGGDHRPPPGPELVVNLDELLRRKTIREKGANDRGEELMDILSKPTAKENANLDKFRTGAGSSAIQEHCPHITKEACCM